MDGAQILEEVICRLGGKEGRTCLTKHVCVDSMWGGCRMRTGRGVGGDFIKDSACAEAGAAGA